MALERLQTWAPILFHSWTRINPRWPFMLEEGSDPNHGRTEHKGGRIYLERRFFDDASVAKNESIRISYYREKMHDVVWMLLD